MMLVQVFQGASLHPYASLHSREMHEDEIKRLCVGLAGNTLKQNELIWTHWGTTPHGSNLYGRGQKWRIVVRRGRYASLK